VESELLSQPEILQAMVFGEAQPALGALIAPSPGADDEAVSAAVNRANDGLPEYARVGRWLRVPRFDPARGEATANGRPRREALAAAYDSFINKENELECPSSPA
jgi:long-subunit acyl-CoA synthetase (AMP-forming)